MNNPGRLNAVEARHSNIHKHHVGTVPFDLGECLRTVSGNRYN